MRRRCWRARAESRGALIDDLSDLSVPRVVRHAQAMNDAGDVGLRPILTHLPLAFESIDLETHADDRLHLRLDVVVGRVVYMPRIRTTGFVLVRESLQMMTQLVRIVDRAQSAVGMHGDIIPGRNDAAGFLLGVVPRRGDVR